MHVQYLHIVHLVSVGALGRAWVHLDARGRTWSCLGVCVGALGRVRWCSCVRVRACACAWCAWLTVVCVKVSVHACGCSQLALVSAWVHGTSSSLRSPHKPSSTFLNASIPSKISHSILTSLSRPKPAKTITDHP